MQDFERKRIARELTHVLTQWDRKQSSRKDYNRYALGIYLGRVDDVVERLARGESMMQAFRANFNDRLLQHVIDNML